MGVLMKYCSLCGATVVLRIPEHDNLPRYVCESCHTIHYQNPKLVTACIPEWEDKVLLCQRGIEPRYGLWTIPGGFMENKETIEQAAIRETWEEAQARLQQLSLYCVFSLPHISQVYLIFRAQLSDLEYGPGSESLEVELFTQAQIPWDSLAFPVIRQALTYYFEDRAAGHFPIHVGDILVPPKVSR